MVNLENGRKVVINAVERGYKHVSIGEGCVWREERHMILEDECVVAGGEINYFVGAEYRSVWAGH